jgi:hypothetical protein
MDLRDDKETAKSKNSDKRPAFVSHNQGLAMAGKVGAVKYVECAFTVWFLNVKIIMKMEIEIFIYNFSYLNKLIIIEIKKKHLRHL